MTSRYETRRGMARRKTLVMGLMAGAVLSPSAARAAFFDQLFGTPQAPAYEAAPVQREFPASEGTGSTKRHAHAARQDATADARPKHKSVAAADRTPKLQKTTSLMADKTLRPGDAIMLADGVKVYDGPVTNIHERRQFVALDDACHVSKAERNALVAMAPTPRDHGATTEAGRSVADKVVISRGYQIPDGRSGLVRYVGP